MLLENGEAEKKIYLEAVSPELGLSTYVCPFQPGGKQCRRRQVRKASMKARICSSGVFCREAVGMHEIVRDQCTVRAESVIGGFWVSACWYRSFPL